MPYTGDPATSPTDRVRFLVGDTSLSSPDLSDPEVAYLLDDEGDDTRRAAARAAEVLSAKYAKQSEERAVGPLRLRSLTDKSKKFADLAKRLWAQASSADAALGPYAGGISKADKSAREDDTDRDPTAIARDMMPYPNGSQNNSTLRDRQGWP